MKHTKHKLLSSIATLFVCLAMFIGSTYAWFTDSASTGVNKIQAGNLDIQLLNEAGTDSIEGGTLSWVKAAGASENESVLWEPGVTYYTQGFQIKNAGNLALKFKITINGVTGNSGLLNAIDFYLTSDKSKSFESTNSVSAFDSEYHLAAGEFWNVNSSATSNVIYLAGHMKEDAGNEYQGLSLDNIGITLAATQDTVESDSFNNEYDKDALYSALITGVNRTEEKTADVNSMNKTTSDIALTSGTIPAGTSLFKDSEKNNALTNVDITGKLQEAIKTTVSSDSVTFDISYNYVNSDNTITEIHGFSAPIIHTFELSKGLQSVTVKHSGNQMNSNPDVNTLGDGEYNYNSTTGILKIKSSTFSEFEVSYTYNFIAATGGQGYTTLAEAVEKASSGATITILEDITVTDDDIVNCNDFYWGDPIEAVIPILKDGKILYGAGHTITANLNEQYIICSVVDATIQNLRIHYDNSKDTAIVYSSMNSVYKNVVTSGTLTWTSGNNAAFTTYPFADLTMTNCVNEATLQTTTGDTSFYCSVFNGYALGTGTFTMTDCVNKGSLICGKASMFLANWTYSTKVDFVINNCKNNGLIRSMSNGYYGGAGKYNYCTSDYWDKAHCLTFTFDDGVKYTSSTGQKWYDVESQGSLIGTGTFEFGPFDDTLALTKNDDGTFTITPASVGTTHYIVSVGTYYGLSNGSSRAYVTERVEATTTTTTTIKALGFVTQKWVNTHTDATQGTLKDYNTYTLDGNTYYLIDDSEAIDTSPRGPEMISVSAFNGDTLVAAASLAVK